MPRQAKIRWHKVKRCWYACIGEPDAKGQAREVYAPPAIGPDQESEAWDWFKPEQARRRSTAPVVSGEESAEWILERYLAWAEKQVIEGKLPSSEFANRARHLGIFAKGLGPRVARTLTSDEMTAFAEGLQDVYSPTYSRNVCASVRAAFNWAVKPGKLLTENPIRGYKVPLIPRSLARFAERSEAAAFVGFRRSFDPRGPRKGDKPRDPWRKTLRGSNDRMTLLLVRVLIRTGARPKELCVLKWADIRWDGWKSSSGHACAKAVIPYTRWKAGKATGKPRTIYFTPAITRALRRIWDRGAPNREWVFVKGPGRGGAGRNEPWPSGSRLSKTILRFRRRLIAWQAPIRERVQAGDSTVKTWERRWAAVEVRDEGHDRLVNYRWRHTAISTLLMLGVDVPTVAELTGTSPEMIYKHYGHLLDSHLAAAAEKLAGRQRQ